MDRMYVDGIAIALATTLIGFYYYFIHYYFCDICLIHKGVMLNCCGFVVRLARRLLGASEFFQLYQGQSRPHHCRML